MYSELLVQVMPIYLIQFIIKVIPKLFVCIMSKQLVWLSKGNYCVQKQGKDVYFNDLRFGFLSRWEGIDTAFALRYNLAPGADNSRPLNRTRFTEPKTTVLGRLVRRVLGN